MHPKITNAPLAGSCEAPCQPKIVLASSSPFRKMLLEKIQLDFVCVSPQIEERPLPGESPEQLAERLGVMKARALSGQYPAHLIIGSDQVAVAGEKQLKKPGDKKNAERQLREVSGRCIRFYTSVSVLDTRDSQHRQLTEVDVAQVQFRKLSQSQIERYIAHDEPYQCAGAFKSESLGIALVERLIGDDPNALIGLPLIRLIRILETFGVRIP